MQKHVKLVALICGYFYGGAVFADSVSDSLQKIETETLILKARERQLDVQDKIISKQRQIASKRAESERVTQSAVVGNPMILSIEGLGKNMSASLQLEGGGTADVFSGDILSNGMKVVSIRPNEVIVENGQGKRIRLAGAARGVQEFDTAVSPSAMNFPPLPPPLAHKGFEK